MCCLIIMIIMFDYAFMTIVIHSVLSTNICYGQGVGLGVGLVVGLGVGLGLGLGLMVGLDVF